MEIVIVRHGIAEESSPASGGDAARSLTEEGRKKTNEVAEALARMNLGAEHIFASPLARAIQTAKIIGASLKLEVETMEELAPGCAPEEVCRRLGEFPDAGCILLVGHEPNCSTLVAHLICEGDLGIEFKKCGVCAVGVDRPAAGQGVLLWHLPPRLARLMR